MKLARKDQVLKCIVEEYIKTASPVGSENLLKNYNLNCSSATIRNAMAQLEKEGYLEKTHISSGRVPSAKGYQHYLEHLDSSRYLDSIDMDFQRELVNFLSDPTLGVEEVINKVCQILSNMTNMVTIYMKDNYEEKLVKVEVIPLSEDKILGLFVTDKGNIKSKTFLLNKRHFFDKDKAAQFVSLLSENISGLSLREVISYIDANRLEIEKVFGYVGIISLTTLKESILQYLLYSDSRWKIYGKYNLFSHSEYVNDPEAIVNVLETLSNPDMLQHNFASSDDLGDVKISFTNDKAGDLAIVTKTILDNQQISLIGPKRMNYKKVLSSLDYVCYLIENYSRGNSKEGAVATTQRRVKLKERRTKDE